MSASPTIRRELRARRPRRDHRPPRRASTRPEYGVDSTFEAHVAAASPPPASAAGPRAREAIWIVELDGRHAGSLALTDEGDGLGGAALVRARPEPARARASGAGWSPSWSSAAEADGYERLGLETFSELRAAAHIYRSHGFELRLGARPARAGAATQITYQRYELSFQARAQSSSSPSTGSSERPFSVSA